MFERKNIITYILLALLLGLAAVLRLYHPLTIPYTYDEFSALNRTHFNNFTDLIVKGVMTTDTHPAGIQVFLYYWTKFFGYSEIIVKLPFIVLGILSVLYMFLIAKDWFNSTTGLVCAAYMATLQYTIMYSQLARPYMSGVFFCLAMVYHWNKIVFKPGKNYDLHWLLYVLFAALCAYNHHFSLLFAAMVGITGIFFPNRRYITRYITSGIMIFVLYIPHLHIFFYQLSKGGIGSWLGKPHNDFLLSYLRYAFQFSPIVYACGGALILTGIVSKIWTKKLPNKFVLISFVWFLIPAFAGFFYSRFVNPVLQYSGLIFCFPFLLCFLMGLLPDVHAALKAGLVLVVCSVNVWVLVYERRHYDIFYHSPYEQNALLTDSVQRAIGKKYATSLMELDIDTRKIEHYYATKYRLDTSFVLVDTTMDEVSFTDMLEDHPRQYLSYASLVQSDPKHLPVILNYYPYLVKQCNFYGGAFYLFSSVPNLYKSPYIYSDLNDFEKPAAAPWTYAEQSISSDSVYFSGKRSFKMDSLHEWGPTYANDLSSVAKNKNDIITVSAAFYPLGKMDDVLIISELQSGGKTIDWRASSVNDFIMVGTKKRWVKAYHAIKLSDIYLNYPDVKLKIFIWNKGKRNFYLDDFEVKVLKGNPIVYGLNEKI